MIAHTPGPWIISGLSMETGSVSVGSEAFRLVICDVTNAASLGDFISSSIRGRRDFGAPDTAKTQWANARLIAASPDLLEALTALVQASEAEVNGKGAGGYFLARLTDARDAIAKARGAG